MARIPLKTIVTVLPTAVSAVARLFRRKKKDSKRSAPQVNTVTLDIPISTTQPDGTVKFSTAGVFALILGVIAAFSQPQVIDMLPVEWPKYLALASTLIAALSDRLVKRKQ